MKYPFDPLTREYVARLLYEALPGLYRTEDEPPRGRGELRQLLSVLAVPLAVLRQNIEELYADLFIDTANDWVIPHLAEMVGTTLLFADADTNRRDVRETVGWRRRKGTPAMLQDLAETLSGRLAVTQEGWKLLQMTQDLNLPRPERRVPDLRDPVIAETAVGPLADTHHAVDVRPITKTTGQFHPRHVVHWTHPTLLFQVREGTPADRTRRDPGTGDPTDPDLRFAFHPLGQEQPLRARRTGEQDPLRTDRVPAMHFAADPGAWFGIRGRFTVHVAGLPAAVARPSTEPRQASRVPAAVDVLEGDATIQVLDHPRGRFYGPVRIELVAAPFAGPPPALPDTTPGAFEVRARLDLGAGPAPASVVVNNGPVDASDVVMLRLTPVGAGARFFPGATAVLTGGLAGAGLGSRDAELARAGFLRGALFVELPATQVLGARWFYLAADGSLHEAQSTGTGAADVPLQGDGGVAVLEANRLLSAGPGAAWPPLQATSDPEPWTRVPSAPGRGPVVMHGGRVLLQVAGAWQDVTPATACSLVFALAYVVEGVRRYEPFVRLRWQGPDPAGADWTALGADGLPTAADPRLAVLAGLRDTGPAQLRLAVRFECGLTAATLAPAEVSWTSYDGRTVLIHLPELATQAGSPVPHWPTEDATYPGVSPAVTVGADGSSWHDGTTTNARLALGSVAPLREYIGLRRRRVAYRNLCPWRNEDPAAGAMHAPTRAGWLDVDVLYGLFALALAEPPQPYPVGPDGPPTPPAVTVEYQEGYTAHLGALGAAREPWLDRRLATPTRLVSGSGHLHGGATADFHDLPRYRRLADALAAIAAAPQAVEVVQFEDSATYPEEDLTWPAGPESLTIQAAEEERPVIEVSGWAVDPAARYDVLTLLGLRLGSAGVGEFNLPPAARVAVEFCTVTRPANTLVFADHPDGVHVRVERCLTAGLRLDGPGRLGVADCVVDAGKGSGAAALAAESGRIEMDRVTVFGTTRARELDASEVYFDEGVTVSNRFAGCVRYSRVTGDSTLPRTHRVVPDVEVGLVAVDRHDPAHARFDELTGRAVLAGAEDGGEIGAFHDVRLAQRYTGLLRRLLEYTPAGLVTDVLRVD